MSTLREAVESGRRWRFNSGRYQGGFASGWILPGVMDAEWTTTQALSSDFEIEPEKPREWRMRACTDPVYTPVVYDGPELKEIEHVRVHDADACDERLRNKKGQP